MGYVGTVDERFIYDNAPSLNFNGLPPFFVPTQLGTLNPAYGKLNIFGDEDVYDLGSYSQGTTLRFGFDGQIWKTEFGATALGNARISIIDSAGNVEFSGTFYDYSTASFFDFLVLNTDRYYLVIDTFASTGQYAVGLGVVNYPPYAIVAEGTLSISEFARAGTKVGTLIGSDEGPVGYALLNDAGGRFGIDAVTGELFVKNGLLLDYEQATFHVVSVVVMDAYGASLVRDFAVSVANVGVEVVTGDAGANRFVGGASSDRLSGAGGSDLLEGWAGNDLLDGGTGDDFLFAGTGIDRLQGGSGNDTYVTDGGDAIVEAANAGTDTVHTTTSLVLATNVENLVMLGAASINGTGNTLANRITGNNGNNVLTGGLGADVLIGGFGNDTYNLENGTDVISDTGGIDTVTSTITRSIASLGAIENLTLLGVATANGTGNTLANVITGNGGANTLTGAGGNDTLLGGAGNDSLIGGTGNDRLSGGAGLDSFVFNTALGTANIDTLTDFYVPQDTIRLDNAVMAGLGAAIGTLSAGKFLKNTTGLAQEADDRIIYETDTGKLFYDANGVAKGGAVHFATLSNKPALTHLDLVVI